MKEHTITLTETAAIGLQDTEFFKSQFIGVDAAATFIESLLLRSVAAISEDPTRYRINGILADKGVRIREWLDVDNEYRCFYDDSNHAQINILLYASMKEDFESALYRHNVIY
ncbi:hypothetical protein ACEU59_15760 [Buttiauxella noackiae]|uniref:hypothetical protein n=1 Tax=Buttiauxella noackiae TaxID=82992 RepID=UPI0035A62802